ncbi:MAG: hypothetical protein KY393_01110, partial [Actinobacteria bacterium]|nr:hypothetical protein [Actinomycetota bacterium]
MQPGTGGAFKAVNEFFNAAADIVELSDAKRAVLGGIYRELRVQVLLYKDNGDAEVLTGYRIQHNGARGPYKGGVRFHPSANVDEVRALGLPVFVKPARGGSSIGITKVSDLADLPLAVEDALRCDPKVL